MTVCPHCEKLTQIYPDEIPGCDHPFEVKIMGRMKWVEWEEE